MKISTCSHRPILTPCNLQRPNYQVDLYVGCEHYCYYCYALDQAETDWGQEIQIHDDITDQLGRELDGIFSRMQFGYIASVLEMLPRIIKPLSMRVSGQLL